MIFFISVTDINDYDALLPTQIPRTEARFNDIHVILTIQVDDVIAPINTIDSNKSSEPDASYSIVFKQTIHSLAPFLTSLFTRSLHEQTFPSAWNKAHVIPT